MTETNRRESLIRGPIRRHLLRMTVPMIWGILAIFTYNLADTYFIGQLGTLQLAAFSYTFPVVMTLSSLAIGLGAGAASVISRAQGEGASNRVRTLTTHGLVLSVLIVLAASLAGLYTIEPLFRLLGAGEETLPFIREYMQIWYLGMPLLVVPMVGNSIIRAVGDALFPSLIMVTAAVVNIILDPILIFGKLGAPELGIAGAAWATVGGNAVTFIGAFLILHFREQLVIWHWRCLISLHRSAKEILYIGLPAAGSNMINPIGIGVVTRMVSGYGPAAVAGFGVATRIESIAVVVLLALSAGIGPVVGQNWGADHFKRVRRTFNWGYLFCIGAGLAAAAVLALIAPWITPLFDESAEVQKVANLYLWIVPVSFLGYGITIVGSAGLNAIGRPLRATALTAVRMFVVYLPLAWLLMGWMGISGIFLAALIANFVAGAATAWVTLRQSELASDSRPVP